MKQDMEAFLKDTYDWIDSLTSQQDSPRVQKDPFKEILARLDSASTQHALEQLEQPCLKLSEQMEQAQRRSHLMASIQAMDAELSKHHRCILETLRKLHISDTVLTQVMEQARLGQTSAQEARQGKVSIQDLISYAHRISKYSAAPFNWTPNSTDMGVPVYPPIPQDMHMKRSLLFQPDPSKPMAASDDMGQQQQVAMDMDFLAQHLQGSEVEVGDGEEIVVEEELLDLDL